LTDGDVPVVARDALTSGILILPLFAAPFLPIYTLTRSHKIRCAKWVALAGALLLIFGPDPLRHELWSLVLFAKHHTMSTTVRLQVQCRNTMIFR
jgi:hypothetical protein